MVAKGEIVKRLSFIGNEQQKSCFVVSNKGATKEGRMPIGHFVLRRSLWENNVIP